MKIEEQSKALSRSYRELIRITVFTLVMIVVSQWGYFLAFNISRESVTPPLESDDNIKWGMPSNQFESYDDKVLTSTQVESAYQLFEGRPFAIIINTNSYKKLDESAKSKYDTVLGINYNALIDISDLELTQTGYYKAKVNFKESNGSTEYNLNKEKNFRVNDVVQKSSKLDSRLIKDDTGEVVGIVFEQNGLKTEGTKP